MRRGRGVPGIEYLNLATTLLHSARRSSPTGGVWEAADLQWWWRRDQHRDPNGQTFWFDNGSPIAASVVTNWGDHWQCDLLSAENDCSALLSEMWPRALEQFVALTADRVELIVRPDDRALIQTIEDSGFEADEAEGVTAWMDISARPAVSDLPAGFRLMDRSQAANREHPFVKRNGPVVAGRLAECSLYQPRLDLTVYAPNEDVAAFGLFWPDPVTKVGLVEPMRTEENYQGRGIASHLLACGLERLAESGCTRAKVSFDVLNEPARRLYLGGGFRPVSTTRSYLRSLPSDHG